MIKAIITVSKPSVRRLDRGGVGRHQGVVMKNGWQTSTLGEVLAVLRNGVNCKQDKSGNGDKISRIESIADASFDVGKVGYSKLSENDKERYHLQQGDILFSHINSAVHVGKTAIFDCEGPVYHGVNLLLMRPKNIITSAYLDHALKHLFWSGYWRRACKQSVNQASVNQQDISKVEIRYPKSLNEQNRIVSVLDDAFEGIATAKANAEKNLQNSGDLFESYLQNIFANPGEEWEGKKLGDIGKVSMCKRVFKDQTTIIGDIPFYKIGTFGKEPNAYISHEIYDEFRKKFSFPKKGDILISASGTIGRRVKYDGKPAYFQDSNIVWIDNVEKQVLNDYLYYFYGACNWNSTKGATISRLYNDNLKQIKIVFPKSLAEQRAFVAKLDALSVETKRLEEVYHQKLTDLEELKRSVLHKAFNGELAGACS